MQCDDCGGKNWCWREYCRRCGGQLYKSNKHLETEEHSFLERMFRRNQY